jgi:hypothetical protein
VGSVYCAKSAAAERRVFWCKPCQSVSSYLTMAMSSANVALHWEDSEAERDHNGLLARPLDAQYTSLRSALSITMQRQGWKVVQVSFIAGARSRNEEELKRNLAYFKVFSASVEPIRAKLAMKMLDEYANILKGMYSVCPALGLVTYSSVPGHRNQDF